MRKKRASKDYSGRRYGRLTALYRSSLPGKWVWKCDCGNVAVKGIKSVRDGKTSSCGCIAREVLTKRNTKHGLSRLHPRTYRTWKDMRSRCYNPNNDEYHNYGGRGITIDPAWDDFGAFYRDMGARPEGMTIDRIDVNGNYTADNCRWATAETQANNKRNNNILTIDGETKTLSQWCRIYGVDRSKARYRLKHGLDPFSKEDFRL